MLGLCHVCFTSGIPIQFTKGLLHCQKCIGIKEKEVEKKQEKILAFEDLPQASPEEREENLTRIGKDMFDRIYHKKMNSERVLEVI